jgi:selenocysteine lyase/cysteine desulfurase
MLIYIYIYL